MKKTEQLYIDRWILDGPLDQVISDLTDKREYYKETHTNLLLVVGTQEKYGEVSVVLELTGQREETPDEIIARTRQENFRTRNFEFQERETLRKLKAKYESGDSK